MTVAKVLLDGKKQSVVLPENYRVEGDEVYVKKVGNAIVLLSKDKPWQLLIESLDFFSDDFMNEREQPKTSERERIF